MIVRGRSPVRICDIGGWTDTHFAEHGAVCNLAVTLYAHVLVRSLESSDSVMIRALDMHADVNIDNVKSVEYDGNLDLLKAAVKRMDIQGGCEAIIWSDAPPGSGVGSSASVGVGMIDALARFSGKRLPPHTVAKFAHELETDELGLECGVQDQYAAAFGGVCFMDISYPQVEISRLAVAPEFLWELEERIVLVYVGQSRLSDGVHRRVIQRYTEEEETTRRAMQDLRDAAYAMKDALLDSDMAGVVTAISANWDAQIRLHPDISSDEVAQAFDIATASGAAAGKANGAGGGGTVVFVAEPGRELELRQALGNVPGWSVLPCRISNEGVRSWVVE